MKITSTYAVFFSPTDGSKKSAISIARGLEGELQEIDLTLENNQEYHFYRHDVVVFGFPVYGGRVVHVGLERLKHIHGDHTPCIISVTYGNRDYDDALLELFMEVKKRGFIPVGAAALIGEHTYGQIQVGRTHQTDLNNDELFGSLVQDKIKNDHFSFVSIPGSYPFRQGGQAGHFYPETNEQCIHCGKCVNHCPVHAISDDCKTIDENRCLACFRCLKKCPVHAKNLDHNAKYQEFIVGFNQKLKEPKNNQYFI